VSVGRIVALGSALSVDGFALAGAEPVHAEFDDEVRRCWETLPDDTALVILTPAADAALGSRRRSRPHVLTVVMPA